MIPYVYIVVRTDIKREYQLVQACHSALEAGYSFSKPETTTHLVVLAVDNKWDLEAVAYMLDTQNIEYRQFIESWGEMGLTALATKPIVKQTDGILQSLPLLCYGDNKE
jgi:hypothetical protein